MNSDDRKRIVVNWRQLVENIMVADVCDILISVEVIDDEEYEEIVVLQKTRKERVRTLLGILMKKTKSDVLDAFCRALVEADPVYEYLAETIRHTDISSVADADTVDSRNSASHKQEALVETVLTQSNELMKLNEMYRQQIYALTERNEILERRQSCLLTLEGSGFTEKSLVQFVDVFVLAKNIKQDTAVAHSAVENFPCPNVLQKMSSESLSLDQLKACWLSIHVVEHVLTAKCRFVLPNSFQHFSAKLCSIVDEQMRDYPDLFCETIKNLHISEINGLNTFDTVADELFLDGMCNWGRVSAWFAFCASLAKNFPDNTSPETLEFYAVFCWYYIDKRMCDWIQKAGGWDGFLEFLSPSSVVRKLFDMTVDLVQLLWRHLP